MGLLLILGFANGQQSQLRDYTSWTCLSAGYTGACTGSTFATGSNPPAVEGACYDINGTTLYMFGGTTSSKFLGIFHVFGIFIIVF
jgi:hypothetical protein